MQGCERTLGRERQRLGKKRTPNQSVALVGMRGNSWAETTATREQGNKINFDWNSRNPQTFSIDCSAARGAHGKQGLCNDSATGDFRSYRFSRLPVQVGDVAGVVRPFGFAWRIVSVPSQGSCYEDIAVQVVGRNGSELGDAGVCVQRASVSGGVLVQRTPDLLCDDDVVLYIQETGQRTVSQLGREATVGAGSGLRRPPSSCQAGAIRPHRRAAQVHVGSGARTRRRLRATASAECGRFAAFVELRWRS
jgi:hypothetical protein